jgi:uncharacterized OB-fold protein
MSDTPKPLPRRDGLNGEFYAHCAKGELRFQRCTGCKTWRHMPRYSCAECGSREWSWEKSTGRGKLYSWTVSHRAFHPAYANDVPYAVAIVELEEGLRIVSQIVDAKPDSYRLDLPLDVVFEKVGDDVTMPKFRVR